MYISLNLAQVWQNVIAYPTKFQHGTPCHAFQRAFRKLVDTCNQENSPVADPFRWTSTRVFRADPALTQLVEYVLNAD